MTRARLIAGAIALLVVIGTVFVIYHKGESAGGDKAAIAIERDHSASVTDARTDERTAAASTAVIASRVARADEKTDAYLRSTIKDLRDALDAVPPAVAGDDAVPAAPVDQLRDTLNASIDHANRAAGDAGAAE